MYWARHIVTCCGSYSHIFVRLTSLPSDRSFTVFSYNIKIDVKNPFCFHFSSEQQFSLGGNENKIRFSNQFISTFSNVKLFIREAVPKEIVDMSLGIGIKSHLYPILRRYIEIITKGFVKSPLQVVDRKTQNFSRKSIPVAGFRLGGLSGIPAFRTSGFRLDSLW